MKTVEEVLCMEREFTTVIEKRERCYTASLGEISRVNT
jgi:hypothetical protein